MTGDEYLESGSRNDFAEVVEVLGYDGVWIDDETLIAFSPNQIKSATGNQGSFNPDDDCILGTNAVAVRRRSAHDDHGFEP